MMMDGQLMRCSRGGGRGKRAYVVAGRGAADAVGMLCSGEERVGWGGANGQIYDYYYSVKRQCEYMVNE